MNHPITKTLLALGCAGSLAATASAQLPTTYSSGDFLVGFREVGAATSVVVDIGPIANFTLPAVYTIGAGTTLSAQYGAAWETNPNVFFSLSEADASDRTTYVTSPQYLVGVNAGPAKIWNRPNNTNAIKLQGDINTFGSEFSNPITPVANANGTPHIQENSDPNAYANFMPGGTNDAGHASANLAYGQFNPTIEGNFGAVDPTSGTDVGALGVTLNLIQLAPGVGNPPGTDVGTFSLSPDGNVLTYTPEVLPVPEPSDYLIVSLGGALALLCFQINKRRNASVQA